MQHAVDKTQDVMNSFIKAIEELAILRENLARTEVNNNECVSMYNWQSITDINFCSNLCHTSIFQQIIAEVGTVVEARVPKKPRFSQPLQNAEITEGQK